MHISFGGSILFWLLDCPSGFIKWRYLSSLKKETLRSLVWMYTYSPLKEKWQKTLSQSSSLALQLEFHYSVEETTPSSGTHVWTSRDNSRDLNLSTQWILHVLRHIFLGRLMPPLLEVCASRYWSLGPSTFHDDNYLWSSQDRLFWKWRIFRLCQVQVPAQLNLSMKKLVLFTRSDYSVGCAKSKRPAYSNKVTNLLAELSPKGQPVWIQW